MARLLLVLLALSLAWAPTAQATVEGEQACCACKDQATDATLFCALVDVRDDDPVEQRCEEEGGFFLCKVMQIGTNCTFAGLECPVSPAPALAGAPLGTLVALLGAGGFVALRRRRTRN